MYNGCSCTGGDDEPESSVAKRSKTEEEEEEQEEEQQQIGKTYITINSLLCDMPYTAKHSRRKTFVVFYTPPHHKCFMTNS